MTEAEKKKYNKWRIRILISIIVGYGMYYLCRQNLSMIMPAYMQEFGYSKDDMGSILSIAAFTYGVGKFVNGHLSDKSNARYFMPLGLATSAIVTLCLGFNNGIITFGVLWVINNWFQSMGWPPAARMLTHWFAPKELGAKWALGASSHQIGGALTIIYTGYLVENYGWRSAFYLPGLIALVAAFILYMLLRDSPKSMGLPPVETYKSDFNAHDNNAEYEEDNLTTEEIFGAVFCNINIWYMSFANLCLYIVRIGIIYWAPLFLSEFKDIAIHNAKYHVAAYEIVGLLGGISAGWMSDKIMNGQRGPIAAIFMLCLAGALTLFWYMPPGESTLSAILLVLVGFFVYGPQVLVGVASADFSSKKAVGTANGFVGTMAYIGAAISGKPIGKLVDIYGWDAAFIFFISFAMLGCLCFVLSWINSAKSEAIN